MNSSPTALMAVTKLGDLINAVYNIINDLGSVKVSNLAEIQKLTQDGSSPTFSVKVQASATSLSDLSTATKFVSSCAALGKIAADISSIKESVLIVNDIMKSGFPEGSNLAKILKYSINEITTDFALSLLPSGPENLNYKATVLGMIGSGFSFFDKLISISDTVTELDNYIFGLAKAQSVTMDKVVYNLEQASKVEALTLKCEGLAMQCQVAAINVIKEPVISLAKAFPVPAVAGFSKGVDVLTSIGLLTWDTIGARKVIIADNYLTNFKYVDPEMEAAVQAYGAGPDYPYLAQFKKEAGEVQKATVPEEVKLEGSLTVIESTRGAQELFIESAKQVESELNSVPKVFDDVPDSGVNYSDEVDFIISYDEEGRPFKVHFPSNDSVIGTNLSDKINAGLLSNTVYAGGGDDFISAGSDTDQYWEYDGVNLFVPAYSGNNLVYAGDGNDQVGLIGQNNVAYGGSGDDSISSSANYSSLYGEDGDDNLSASGDALLIGGDGNDSLGAWGIAHIEGGNGNDTIGASGGKIIDHDGNNEIYHSKDSNSGGVSESLTVDVANGSNGIYVTDDDYSILRPITLNNLIVTSVNSNDTFVSNSTGLIDLNNIDGFDSINVIGTMNLNTTNSVTTFNGSLYNSNLVINESFVSFEPWVINTESIEFSYIQANNSVLENNLNINNSKIDLNYSSFEGIIGDNNIVTSNSGVDVKLGNNNLISVNSEDVLTFDIYGNNNTILAAASDVRITGFGLNQKITTSANGDFVGGYFSGDFNLGSGDDVFITENSTGSNFVDSGLGDDIIMSSVDGYVKQNLSFSLKNTSGFDYVSLTGYSQVNVNSDGQIYLEISDSVSSNISTSNFNDTILLKDISFNNGFQYSDDNIYASAGNDYIATKEGDDTVNAGLGDDFIVGNYSSGEYVYKKGDGNDVIAYFTKDNIVLNDSFFPVDINKSSKIIIDGYSIKDLEVEVKSSDLILNFGIGDSILLKDYLKFNDSFAKDFNNILFNGYGIDQLVFSDGVISSDELRVYNLNLDSNKNEEVNGYFNAHNNITTGSGNDNITLGFMSDYISAGDGDNIINATDNFLDTSVNSIFKSHSKSGDVIFTGGGNDVINLGVSGGFVDSGDGNDIISVFGGDLEVNASKGSDTVTTDSSVIYHFNKFDGNDTITNLGYINSSNSVSETIVFGKDIRPQDIFITSGTKNNLDLVINFFNTKDSITLENFLYPYVVANNTSNLKATLNFNNGEVFDLVDFIKDNLNKLAAASSTDSLLTLYGINLDTLSDKIKVSEGLSIINSGYYAVEDQFINPSLTDIIEREIFTINSEDVILKSSATSDVVYGSKNNDIIFSSGGSDEIHSGSGDDFISSGDGDDVIYVESKFANIVSGSGNDSIFVNGEDVVINSGTGLDKIYYTVGNLRLKGYGVIEESGYVNDDLIIFTDPTISPDNIAVQYIKNTKDITLSITTDAGISSSIVIEDYFNKLFTNINEKDVSLGIPKLQFSNGFIVDISSLVNIVYSDINFSNNLSPDDIVEFYNKDFGVYITGTDSNDNLIGSNNNDFLVGGNGNDVIYSNGGNDAIDGGYGDDTIHVTTGDNNIWGNSGNDTIIIDKEKDFIDNIDTGSGLNNIVFNGDINNTTIIQNNSSLVSSADVVRFTSFNKSDLSFFEQSSNLIIYNEEHGRTLVINNFFNDSYNKVKGFVFADGTNLTNVEVQTLSTLISDSVTDVFIVESSDIISTNKIENFNYISNSGIVAILENEYSNKDFITLDSFITKSDISLERFFSDSGDHLLVKFGNSDGIALVDYFNRSSNIDIIKFSDGTELSINSLIQSQDNLVRIGSELDEVFIAKTDQDANYSGLAGNDTLTGTGGNDILDGGFDNDSISGGLGNNTIIGGLGDDELIQGNGFDTFVFGKDSGRDFIAQSDNASNGVIKFTSDITAKDLALDDISGGSLVINTPDGSTIFLNDYFSREINIDRLVFADGSEISLKSIMPTEEVYVGTTKNDTKTVSDYHYANFQGGVGNDTLTGGVYVDMLEGGAGNDILDGGAGNDVVQGGTGNDIIIGGAGKNSMTGGTGNDTYIITSELDDGYEYGAFENYNEGTDLVKTYVSTRLSDNIENLTALGDKQVYSVANASNNIMLANDAGNNFFGQDGNDTLTGGKGDDYLDGGYGNDVITGGLGNNTLVGGYGNDTYIVSNSSDYIKEFVTEGTDTVKSIVNFQLDENIENLTLTATDLTGEGNDLNNVIIATLGNNTLIGNAGNDTLTSGSGNDTMSGGIGNDTYNVNSEGDTVVELESEGTDTVKTSMNYALGANIENLTLLGSADLIAIGNELNNTLTSNLGINTLIGGLGNDIYVLNNSLDTVVENINEGTDTVKAGFDYTLGANFENLTLSGTGDFTGTGNELNNVITGNAGNNNLYGLEGNDILTGGAGNDNLYGGSGNDSLNGGLGSNLLVGGEGNDTYTVTSLEDKIVENFNEGVDTVKSSISYTLDSNLENLTLTGTGSLVGTGNEFNNTLTTSANGDSLFGLAGNDKLTGGIGNDLLDGGSDNDTLSGGAGNDILRGGLGNDSLNGGIGSDIYQFGLGDGQDTINNSTIDTTAGKMDQLVFDNNINADQLWFQKSGNNLVISVLNTTDKITVSNWFSNANNHLQEIVSGDGLKLNEGQIDQMIQLTGVKSQPLDSHITGPALDMWHF